MDVMKVCEHCDSPIFGHPQEKQGYVALNTHYGQDDSDVLPKIVLIEMQNYCIKLGEEKQ